jgi:hypothetical protein
MLLNISNHPSSRWDDKQTSAAIADWFEVMDYPFPQIDPAMHTNDVCGLADKIFNEIMNDPKYENLTAVMIQGEFSLVINLANAFHAAGIEVVVATSERNTVENPDGTKTVKFEFCQFRSVFFNRFSEL